MDDSLVGEWTKELKVLLQLQQANPSQDLPERRDRIAILNTLIAGRAKAAA